MANTFSQMYVQLVFAVKHREYLITSKYKELLEKYMCGIIKNNNCKPLAIYCNPDHVHILVGLHPTISVSDLTRDIKACSSKFINQNKWIQGLFRWQDGFGSFTYSKRELDGIVRYILNQAEHHRKKSFHEEYLAFLEEYGIDYDMRYVFDWVDRPQ